MSTFNDIDIECTNCGDEYRGSIWVAVHAGQDPELKDLLLGGELNLVSCPECGYVMFQERFLIYQEPAAELVAYVYPEVQREEDADLRNLMRTGFHEAQQTMPEKQRLDYEPLLFFGLEELSDLLRREEALGVQSQVAQVLCRQNKVESILLRPAHARRLKSMRVIPRMGRGGAPTRDEVLSGIDRLLTIHPVLNLYEELRETIKKDPEWELIPRSPSK